MKEVKKEVSSSEKFKDTLEGVLRATIPYIWIRTQEEDRVLKVINLVMQRSEDKCEGCQDLEKCSTGIKNICKDSHPLLYVWDAGNNITQYLGNESKSDWPVKKAVENPADIFTIFTGDTAVAASVAFKDDSVLVLFDFNFFLASDSSASPAIIRSIKNSLNLLKRDDKRVIFVGPRLPLPEELEKHIHILDFPLPNREELQTYLDFVIESAHLDLSDEEVKKMEGVKEKLIDAALGLTSQEAEDAFSLAIIRNPDLEGDSVKIIQDQKIQILKKGGILECIKSQENMEDIGGLDVLKRWLVQRKRAFGREAREFGIPFPKGILLVGVSGCGKSLTAKAAASNWGLPIYRLDVGKVFTKLMGESESNARKVIEIAEAVAPCVLWIDEIEKGMAGVRSSGDLDSGVTARVTGTLLTWMQEKTSPIFVIATANDVTKLPPELLRKGRFDEIFFVDLPNLEERVEIVKVQLQKVGRMLPNLDIEKVALEEYSDTKTGDKTGYTGAEIEQAVISALYEDFEDGGRDMTADDIIKALKSTVPIAATMKEEIEILKTWGSERARAASGRVAKISSTSKERKIALFKNK